MTGRLLTFARVLAAVGGRLLHAKGRSASPGSHR